MVRWCSYCNKKATKYYCCLWDQFNDDKDTCSNDFDSDEFKRYVKDQFPPGTIREYDNIKIKKTKVGNRQWKCVGHLET